MSENQQTKPVTVAKAATTSEPKVTSEPKAKAVTPKVTVKPQPVEPLTPSVSAKTAAEMEAGRRALEKRKVG